MQTTTYLQNSLQGGRVIRWLDNCMPLKIYIAPFRWYKAKNEGYIYIDMVHQALNAWSSISDRKIQFQIVNELRNSQMNLEWKRIDREALGYCHFNYDNAGRLFSAEIQIGLSDGIIHSKYMKKEEVYHTILHEIGHSLGLGHSSCKSDIMYTPHQYGIAKLSPNDIASINWLYRLPYGANIKEIAQKYKINANNLDKLIAQIENSNYQSDFEKVKSSLNVPQKDLLQEQTNIAELKKYNLFLQDIQVPNIFGKYPQKDTIKKPDNKEK